MMTEIIFWCEYQAVFADIHTSSYFGMISECVLSLLGLPSLHLFDKKIQQKQLFVKLYYLLYSTKECSLDSLSASPECLSYSDVLKEQQEMCV